MAALAAAQLCALGGELNPFSSADTMMSSGEASWETEQRAPWGWPEGCTLGPGEHEGLAKKAALFRAVWGDQTHFTNKGSNILLLWGITCCLGNAVITKVTA